MLKVDKKVKLIYYVFYMKIRFLKTIAVDVETRFADIEDRSFNRWDVVNVNEIIDLGNRASLLLENQDLLIEVPRSAFEVLDKA